MLTHAGVWRAIEELARRHHCSVSGLAVRAGLDSTALNRSKRAGPDGKPRWPSSQTVAHLLTATSTSLSEFASMIEGETAAHSRDKRASIVLVDDSPEIRQVLGDLLQRAGYRVHRASGHREVLDLLARQEHVDLLCTDVVMPESLGGVALARLARERLPGLPVVLMTAYDIPGLAGGSMIALRKPIAPQDFVRQLEQLLPKAETRSPH